MIFTYCKPSNSEGPPRAARRAAHMHAPPQRRHPARHAHAVRRRRTYVPSLRVMPRAGATGAIWTRRGSGATLRVTRRQPSPPQAESREARVPRVRCPRETLKSSWRDTSTVCPWPRPVHFFSGVPRARLAGSPARWQRFACAWPRLRIRGHQRASAVRRRLVPVQRRTLPSTPGCPSG